MRLEDMGSEWSGTIYVYLNTRYGFISVSTNDEYGSDPAEYARLGSVDVTVPIDANRDRILRQQVASLQTKKQNVLAESQRRVDAIDQQIQSLLAIEHKQEGE